MLKPLSEIINQGGTHNDAYARILLAHKVRQAIQGEFKIEAKVSVRSGLVKISCANQAAASRLVLGLRRLRLKLGRQINTYRLKVSVRP